MSQTSTATESLRSARRSTRIDQAVSLTVIGVDSARGPYREEVTTATISCHGCKYESKYDVLHGSVVLLEFNGQRHGVTSTAARGRVRWAKRPGTTTGMYETAIELDEPGNIWGIDAPPQDWLNVSKTRAHVTHDTEAAKSKPFAVARPEPVVAPATRPASPEKYVSSAAQTPFTRETETKFAHGTPARPVNELMKNFQNQMESFLSEAATAAVRERATVTLDDARSMLREEARRVVADAAASAAVPWIEQSLLQIQQASQKSALALHGQWRAKMEDDIQIAIHRIDARRHEFESRADSLANAAIEKLHAEVEASRSEGMQNMVASLRHEFTPLVEQARAVTTDLQRTKHEAEAVLSRSLENFSTRAEELCTRLETRFTEAIDQRLAAARSELEHTSDTATRSAVDNLRNASQHYEGEAQRRLQESFHPVSDAALHSLRETAGEASRQFARELKDCSRTQLESLSNALSELAKSFGKDSQE